VYLIYFDENKYSKECPFFYIGGILLEGSNVSQYEQTLRQIAYNFFGTPILTKDTEMHGKEIFHGKGKFKERKIEDRLNLLNDIVTFITLNKIPIRLVCIDVEKHKSKYIYPQPEYNLGLMLILERFDAFLEEADKLGVVFGDYERDEMKKSILDFSQFKHDGTTPMYFGRPLGRLIDTIYFTHSHHSRFLQIADIIVFLAGRYENSPIGKDRWHDCKAKEMWERIKNETDCIIKRWP
jgi:hypothetical protein